jgi:hypothetical protein
MREDPTGIREMEIRKKEGLIRDPAPLKRI